jgi:hypothetical protein
MRATRALAAVTSAIGLAATGCGRFGFDADDVGGVDAVAVPDGAPDAACATRWEVGRRIAEVASAANDWGPALSADGLTLYFHSDREAGIDDIFAATRSAPDGIFGDDEIVGELFSPDGDDNPALPEGGERIYFSSWRENDVLRIYVAENAATGWGVPSIAPGMELEGFAPWVSADELEMFYSSGFLDPSIHRATRASRDQPWTPQGLVVELNSTDGDGYASVTGDGRTIYWESRRDGGGARIYTATRSARGQPFTGVREVTELNMAGTESSDPDVAPDGRSMIYGSNRAGTAGMTDMYVATLVCE